MDWTVFDVVIGSAQGLAAAAWDSARSVASYPLTPTERLWIPWVLSSALIGAWVYGRTTSGLRAASLRDIARFLFPAKVWGHRSSWVDVRYFFPHQMVRTVIYGAFAAALTLEIAAATQGFLQARLGPDPLLARDTLGARIAVTAMVVVLADFTAYVLHLIVHKVPFLWEFHRVHHSAQVLNPLTTYREHPVENLFFATGAACSAGVLTGSLLVLYGSIPTEIGILGLSLPFLLFNGVGYHLRHSHIWLRWPGVWGIAFGSPAHHQIHHSCRPEHIDKNLAFAFPIWDYLFGTLCLPEEKPEMAFGIGDGTEAQYDGFMRIYTLPFRRLWHRYTPVRHDAVRSRGQIP